MIEVVVDCDVSEIDSYIDELAIDTDVENHIKRARVQGDFPRDPRIAFGRRGGWYAFIRALKPPVVVETGVHHEVGAFVIASVLLRNVNEGYEGRYFGTDLDPGAGLIFTKPNSSVGQIL